MCVFDFLTCQQKTFQKHQIRCCTVKQQEQHLIPHILVFLLQKSKHLAGAGQRRAQALFLSPMLADDLKRVSPEKQGILNSFSFILPIKSKLGELVHYLDVLSRSRGLVTQA